MYNNLLFRPLGNVTALKVILRHTWLFFHISKQACIMNLFGLPGHCEATDNYIAEFEDMLRHSCGKKVAGFIAEYIQV